MLPRTLARRLSKGGRRFPKALRNKWIAIGGLFLLFWLYEWLALWSNPLLTAWVIVAYFVASFVLEMIFTESAFCKYVCPLGTFNMVYSTASPLQITAKDQAVCKTCVGKECLNGSYQSAPVILVDEIKDGAPVRTHTNGPSGVLGCGLELFVPQVKSNLECTMCLDCVRACPHDNVALEIRAPGRELWRRGAWPKRWDVSLLVIMLAFMGMSNAFGMVGPVYGLLAEIQRALGVGAGGALFIFFAVGNVLLPTGLSIGAAWMTLRLVPLIPRKRQSPTKVARPVIDPAHALRDTLATFAPAFVPIGLGMWAAHYGFHFVIGALAIIPVFHNFVLSFGIRILGDRPNWDIGALMTPEQFAPVQLVLLIGGYLLSMLIAQRTALRVFGRKAQSAWIPWALLLLFMMLFGAWVLSQPMEMRGIIDSAR